MGKGSKDRKGDMPLCVLLVGFEYLFCYCLAGAAFSFYLAGSGCGTNLPEALVAALTSASASGKRLLFR